jgi:hypothetical protein
MLDQEGVIVVGGLGLAEHSMLASHSPFAGEGPSGDGQACGELLGVALVDCDAVG